MINVAIVDDHAIVRTGLRQALSEQTDMCIVAEGSTGRDVVDILRRHEVDVFVLDVNMPDLNGVDALAAIRARNDAVGVLFLTGYPAEQFAATLFRQGASGFLAKHEDPDVIAVAIRKIALGKRYITPEVADILAAHALGEKDKLPHELLSEREMQVFMRLAKGETLGAIAESLSLNVKTVSTFRTRMMDKMKLTTNSELTYYAMKQGLID
jgi:two-component system, NarL family, invasion response regulator UvrY